MTILCWFVILTIWSIIGLMILLFLGGAMKVDLIRYALGVEFLNPLVIYQQVRVNWFGAFFLAILYNAMSPLIAVGYWIYKLCTVGRK